MWHWTKALHFSCPYCFSSNGDLDYYSLRSFKFWRSTLVRTQVKLCPSLWYHLQAHSPHLKEQYLVKGWYPRMVALDHSPAMTWRPLPFPSLAPSMIPGRSRSCKIKDRGKVRKGKKGYKSEQIKQNGLLLNYPTFRRPKSNLPYEYINITLTKHLLSVSYRRAFEILFPRICRQFSANKR